MKNKLLLSLLGLFLSVSIANAASDNVHVAMIGEFDTAHPSKKIDVRVVENATLGKYNLKAGDIIHCNIIEVTDPKIGKRAASFAVCPTSFTSDGQTTVISESYYGKYADKVISKEELKNVDPLKVGTKAAVSVGNHFVKGIAPAVSLAKGMVKNEEGNRIESGVKQVYKDSPLSYVEKGQELDLDSSKQFYLKFKPSNKNLSDIAEENIEEE